MIFYPEELKKLRQSYLILKTIVNSKRFYLYNIIAENQPINVTEIINISNIEQPVVSQNLAMLRKSDLVTSKQNKKSNYYSINQIQVEGLVELLSLIATHLEIKSSEIQGNYSALSFSSQVLKMLSNHGRLSILEVIKKNPGINQKELIVTTQMVQSIISQNIKILCSIGILDKQYKGKNARYYINEERLSEIKQGIHKLIEKENA